MPLNWMLPPQGLKAEVFELWWYLEDNIWICLVSKTHVDNCAQWIFVFMMLTYIFTIRWIIWVCDVDTRSVNQKFGWQSCSSSQTYSVAVDLLWSNNLSCLFSFAGHRDTALSEKGVRQARLLAERLRNERFTHIFTSDLQRAKEVICAQLIGN